MNCLTYNAPARGPTQSMKVGAMRGQQLGHSEVPTGGPSALRSAMTVGNPGRVHSSGPPGLSRLRLPYGFNESGRYGRATFSWKTLQQEEKEGLKSFLEYCFLGGFVKDMSFLHIKDNIDLLAFLNL